MTLCWPTTARTGSPRSITPSPGGCSSPTTRSSSPTRTPPTSCSSQARDLAKSEALRARLLFAMGRASQAGGQLPPRDRGLPGLSQGVSRGGRPPAPPASISARPSVSAGKALPARLTWTDLARDLDAATGRLAEVARRRADPRPRPLPDRPDLRHAPAPRRHQPEPGRRRPAAVPRGLSRASAGP